MMVQWDEYMQLDAWDLSNEARSAMRDDFNALELSAIDLLQNYDIDRSGVLERSELVALLSDLRGREPTADEVDWILRIADLDADDKISADELVFALRAWQGYVKMPKSIQDLFSSFDADSSGFLEPDEFRRFLSSVGGREVSALESHEILVVADKLSDGKIGKYELLGAIGAWYISVGRRPTPAMTLAFVANNRTQGTCHELAHVLLAAALAPCAYVSIWVAVHGGKDCATPLILSLWIEGFLWAWLTVVVLLKTRWVQIVRRCHPCPEDSHQMVFVFSWLFLIMEILTCTLLVGVETWGLYWVFWEFDNWPERKLCEEHATAPVELFQSLRSRKWIYYESYVEFCKVWYLFNFIWNFVTLLFYYCFIVWRYSRLRSIDSQLQALEDNFQSARQRLSLFSSALSPE